MIINSSVTDWVLGPFNQWKLTRGQMRNSGKALLGPGAEALRKARTRNRCPCSLCKEGGAGSLNRGEGTADWWVRWRGLRWSACPRGGAVCRDRSCGSALLLLLSTFILETPFGLSFQDPRNTQVLCFQLQVAEGPLREELGWTKRPGDHRTVRPSFCFSFVTLSFRRCYMLSLRQWI